MWSSKPKKRGHNCRKVRSKASRGNPKVGGGICHPGRREAVTERTDGRRIARLALIAGRGGDSENFEG